LIARCLSALLALSILFLAGAAYADPVDDALARFSADKFDETAKAVEALTASGDPQAAEIIGALADGRLLVRTADKAVFYRDAAGALHDGKTGAAAQSDPAGLKAVRLNNRLRGTVQAAMGQLTLISPDPGKRIAAAEAVFRSRDPLALPALDLALSREQDPTAKTGSPQSQRSPNMAARTARRCCARCRRMRRRRCAPPPRPRWRTSNSSRACGGRCRTSATASASARCCCSPPSALPSPSA
jgi:urea transport system permease protein